jgi:hypothetical protein
MSLSEMKDMVDRVAAGPRGLCVGHGDMVAIWTPNLLEWAVTFSRPRTAAFPRRDEEWRDEGEAWVVECA